MEIDITDLFQALAETNLMLFSASPAEMGELFKALAFARGIDVPLAGFSAGDRRHTL